MDAAKIEKMYVNFCHGFVFVSFFIKQLALVHLRNKKTVRSISAQSYNLKTIVILSYRIVEMMTFKQ